MNTEKIHLGERAKNLIDKSNLSLIQISKELGTSPQNLYKTLSKENFDTKYILKLSTILKIPIVSFFYNDPLLMKLQEENHNYEFYIFELKSSLEQKEKIIRELENKLKKGSTEKDNEYTTFLKEKISDKDKIILSKEEIIDLIKNDPLYKIYIKLQDYLLSVLDDVANQIEQNKDDIVKSKLLSAIDALELFLKGGDSKAIESKLKEIFSSLSKKTESDSETKKLNE
jgi:transcriptional regulator with XRE-family HTH domain